MPRMCDSHIHPELRDGCDGGGSGGVAGEDGAEGVVVVDALAEPLQHAEQQRPHRVGQWAHPRAVGKPRWDAPGRGGWGIGQPGSVLTFVGKQQKQKCNSRKKKLAGEVLFKYSLSTF